MSEKFRDFLKDSIQKTIDFSITDQGRGIKSPPAEKPCNPEDKRINLIKPGDWKLIHEVSVGGIMGTDTYFLILSHMQRHKGRQGDRLFSLLA